MHPLSGKNLALTGKFAGIEKPALKGHLESLGAKVSGSVTGKTDLFVYGGVDTFNGQLTKAVDLDTPQLNQTQVLEWLAAQGVELEADVARAEARDQADATYVRSQIDPVRARFVDTYGTTLPTLLRHYARLFALRPDVSTYDVAIGAPAPIGTLRAKANDMLLEGWLAFAEEIDGFTLNWSFADQAEAHEREGRMPGASGGRLALPRCRETGLEPVQAWKCEEGGYEGAEGLHAFAVVDAIAEEGRTLFCNMKGKGRKRPPPKLVFENNTACTFTDLDGSLFDYLTRGARAAFAWSWPTSGATHTSERLLAASMPAGTDPDGLEAALVALETPAGVARGLVHWLGDDVRLLLPA